MLKRGQRFTIGGAKWRVAYVNFSRAHCVSEQQRTVSVTDPKTGEPRTFIATSQQTMDISPDSQLELLKDLR